MTDTGVDAERANASRGVRRVLFVTGKLAEPALRRVLSEADLPFSVDVAVMRITVAALMTTEWIARFLEVPSGIDLVMIPGLCEGDVGAVAAGTGVRVEKGPKDLREIPHYFGRAEAARDYGAWDIEILAEINNAPRLTPAAIRAAAEYFRTSGADVIDIGCTPGLQFPNLGAIVRDLASAGMRVSIDTFDAHEIRAAVEAGAELGLSVNGANIDVARDLAGSSARVVRHDGSQRRKAGGVGCAVSARSDPRAGRVRLHGVDRALRRDPPPLPGC